MTAYSSRQIELNNKAIDLCVMFLKGRDSMRLTVKQSSWLRDVIDRAYHADVAVMGYPGTNGDFMMISNGTVAYRISYAPNGTAYLSNRNMMAGYGTDSEEAERMQRANMASLADGGWVLHPAEY